MSVIALAAAMEHVRAEDHDMFIVLRCLESAEDRAQSFMQRNIYVDDGALANARDTVAAVRSDARAAYKIAVDAANAIEDSEVRAEAMTDARRELDEALTRALQIQRGIVITPAIRGACLLITGHLYENRESVVIGTISSNLPQGADSLLWPYRAGLGV